MAEERKKKIKIQGFWSLVVAELPPRAIGVVQPPHGRKNKKIKNSRVLERFKLLLLFFFSLPWGGRTTHEDCLATPNR
jgi:hypothetical protein